MKVSVPRTSYVSQRTRSVHDNLHTHTTKRCKKTEIRKLSKFTGRTKRQDRKSELGTGGGFHCCTHPEMGLNRKQISEAD